MSRSILISDPDQDFSQSIKNDLMNSFYRVVTASNGKDCQSKLHSEKYSLLILDIETRDHSGMEVLKYVKCNSPGVRVILTADMQQKNLAQMLNKDEIYKLGVSDLLKKPYSIDMLVGLIERAGQYESWKSLSLKQIRDPEETLLLEDNEFTHVPIDTFYNGNTTIFDLFIRLSPNKYIKLLERGDFFDSQRVLKYQERGMEFLYFKTKDRFSYINYVNGLLEKMNLSESVSTPARLSASQNLIEKYVEEVYLVGLNPQLVKEGKKITENIYKLLLRDKKLGTYLLKFEDRSPSEFSHSFLVCIFSAMICKNLEWSSPKTIEMVALGGMLHDLGKIKFASSTTISDPEKMTSEQRRQYESHPRQGVIMLEDSLFVSEGVRQIVYQHHETCDGEGFPSRLTGSHIYPPAKIVGLANFFANLMRNRRQTPLQALREFKPDRRMTAKYDPTVIKGLVMSFKREN